MTIDLSQFHQVFFEESHEGLDAMESGLLTFDVEQPDDETINAIFRAAHSIKGGSGTFGFAQIADFTHILETLLDLVRAGEFVLQSEHVDLLLRAVDCVRRMISQLEAGEACDTETADALKAEFQQAMSGEGAVPALGPRGDSLVAETAGGISDSGWQIYFKPEVDVLRTGNEPLRMFRELGELGQLKVAALTDDLPEFRSLDPTSCYLAWELTLWGDASREEIEEVFEWVADESDITITPLSLSANKKESKSGVADSAELDLESSLIQEDRSATDINALPQPSPPTPKKEVGRKDSKQEVTSIRVSTDKVDSLINMVGELVITQSMLGELGSNFTLDQLPKLLEGLEQLNAHTRELQESVMRIRMLPISFAFSRFPRLVRDISQALGKKVELELLGEQTELDKTVLERIVDPLVHLVRNSLDHGLESPAKRLEAGKSEVGKITLNAYHQGGNIVIEIIDDGAGLNRQKILEIAQDKGLVKTGDVLSDEQIDELIFKPGFSTATEVTDLSGRGVGMDVVRRNIQDLNGLVDVSSTPGKGSRFTIRLPLTLAILDGQLVRVGQQVFVVPLVSIVESLEQKDQVIHAIADDARVLRLRDEFVPVIALGKVFGIAGAGGGKEGLLVVVEGGGHRVALQVDELMAQQQVVIKSLEENYCSVEGISGATILGDGTVSLIVDITGVVRLASIDPKNWRHLQSNSDIAAA